MAKVKSLFTAMRIMSNEKNTIKTAMPVVVMIVVMVLCMAGEMKLNKLVAMTVKITISM